MNKTALWWAYRMLAPVVDARAVRQSFRNMGRYPAYVRSLGAYRRLAGGLPARVADLWPQLGDQDSSSQTGGGHYFYQDVWALNKLAASTHPYHVDVGSRVDGFVGQATAIKPVIFIDIRPVQLAVERLRLVDGSLLQLPLRSASVPSLSCLHVIEHIGLGRYGDPLNPHGPALAARELARALAPGGDLYVGVPVGRPSVQFNAHRVLGPSQVTDLFGGLELVDFAGVDDEGAFCRAIQPGALDTCRYACGLFHFRKPD